MPGKVNLGPRDGQPGVLPGGCDATILIAAEAGQLELNVMMPVIAWNAIHATRILGNVRVLQRRSVADIEADEERTRELLDRSTAVATALSPYRHAATADVAKTAVSTGRSIRELVLERGLLSDEKLDRITSAEAMTLPGVPGSEEEQTLMAKLIVQTALILAAVATLSAAPQQHSRLFPPEKLGSLEGPDRDAWQRPDQVMDKLLIAEGSVVADLGAGGGWFTMRSPAASARTASFTPRMSSRK